MPTEGVVYHEIACAHQGIVWERHAEKALPANAREDVVWWRCPSCGIWKLANRNSKGV